MNKLALSVAVIAALSSIPAGAAEPVATLLDVQGKVLINKGEGFVAATNGVALNPTDKLLVGAESQAVVSYPVCSVTLAESSLFAVAAKAPCQLGETVAAIDSVLVGPAGSINCSSTTYTDSCAQARGVRDGTSSYGKVLADGRVELFFALGAMLSSAFIFVTFVEDDKPVSGK